MNRRLSLGRWLPAVAIVAGIESGRTITSRDDPDADIRTRLVELRLDRPLRGEPPERLVVDEAAAFTDDTPIAVDGMAELPAGEQAVWFLISGSSDAMPYYTTVKAQARYHVVGDTLDPAGDDNLSRRLADLGADELVAAIAAVGDRRNPVGRAERSRTDPGRPRHSR